MVKADAKQDYYGDLGLPVSADHEEIKRHFRLLGTSVMVAPLLLC